LPKHFRIKVTTIEKSKDLKEMKIEEIWDLFKLEDHCPEGFQEKGRSLIWR